MRKTSDGYCPKCRNKGEITDLNGYNWKCTPCDMDWDTNEDFKCMECGKDVFGRYLFCSQKCSDISVINQKKETPS